MGNVLDHGFVNLIDRMGDDYSILRAARVSTGSEPRKGDLKDRGLLRYLWLQEHMSPFEAVEFQFYFKTPIFIARQIFRHRTFAFSELSARYTEFENFDYYTPEFWRKQGTTNHQGSGENIEKLENQTTTIYYRQAMDKCIEVYKTLLQQGISRELARGIMPVATYTEFYMKGNLRNWFHFLELRLHEHAQMEVRVYAEDILKQLKQIDGLKWSIEIFEECLKISNSMSFLKTKFKNELDELDKDLEKIYFGGEDDCK